MNSSNKLRDIAAKDSAQGVAPDIMCVATKIAGKYGASTVGMFFYGSCMRTGKVSDKILDFYVIVDEYNRAYKSRALAYANWLCPPNVFYYETDIDGQTLRSKYTVISLDDFIKRCGSKPLNSSVWARFCQPSILMLERDDKAGKQLMAAIEQAIETAVTAVLPLFSYVPSSMELWSEIFRRTYDAELRSERRQKALEIYIIDQERYDALTEIIYKKLGLDPGKPLSKQPPRLPIWKARCHWWLRRINGKTVSFLRLMKASRTFDGGIDYLAWKIKRHSGVELKVKPWMRKHPILAGLVHFWRMKSRDAFR